MNNRVLTELSDVKASPIEVADFGVYDSKGRAIGAEVTRSVRTYVETKECYGSKLAPGSYYSVRIQLTKNREWFGATQKLQHFETEAERDAYITKRLAQMKKRAAKTK